MNGSWELKVLANLVFATQLVLEIKKIFRDSPVYSNLLFDKQ